MVNGHFWAFSEVVNVADSMIKTGSLPVFIIFLQYMKLLYKIKLKSFLTGSILLAGLFLFIGFGGIRNAKAEMTVSTLTLNSNWTSITLPSHSDKSVIICSIGTNYYGAFSFTLNGKNSSSLTAVSDNYGERYNIIQYLDDIPINEGVYSLAIHAESPVYTHTCFLVDGVNKTDLIASTVSGTVDSSVKENNILLTFIASRNNGSGYTGTAIGSSNFTVVDSFTHNGLLGWAVGYKIATSTTWESTFTEAGAGALNNWRAVIVELNAYTPPPIGTAYWAGVGSQRLHIDKTNKVPIYYNFCSNYNDIKRVDFVFQPKDFFINSYTENIIKDKTIFIGPQNCSGMYYATINPEKYFSPTTGTLADEYIGFFVTLNDESNKIVPVYIPYTTEGSSLNYIENGIIEPLVIDIDNTTSTDFYFNYDFTGLTSTSTEVCAFFNMFGDSDNCTTIAGDKPQGYGIINIPNLSRIDNVYWGFHSSKLDLKSETKKVIYWSTGKTIVAKYSASTTIASLFGDKSSHDLACSVSDWAEADTAGFFNLIRLKCSVFEGTIELFKTTSQGISNIVDNAISGFGAVLSNLFPFNIPYNIVTSFNNSKAELPLSLIYFDQFDANNAISIKIPKQWTGEPTDMVVPIFGKTVLAPTNTPEGNFFEGVRAFSVYAIWFLYIKYMWEFAIKIKDELYPEGSEDHFYFRKYIDN